jgi:gamma-tubulin complex component 2
MKSLTSATNVDLVIKQHLYYLDTCMKECLLTNPKLLKVQAKLFVEAVICTGFLS